MTTLHLITFKYQKYCENLHPGNLSGELYDFAVKFGVYIKKLKFETPHVDGHLRKNLKHQVVVDNNTW